jgi:hypothetical protein
MPISGFTSAFGGTADMAGAVAGLVPVANDPMQTLAEWRKQVAVPVMQALDREVANSAARLSSRRDAFHVCSCIWVANATLFGGASKTAAAVD